MSLLHRRQVRWSRAKQFGYAQHSSPHEIGLASDRVAIDTVVSKHSDHLPPYRHSAMLERETGLEISRAALDGWVMRVGKLPIPAARRDGS
jgi:hypothetical protein